MTQLTKKAIVNSFIKLLNDKPWDKITVKDIVEDCGIISRISGSLPDLRLTARLKALCR